MSTLHRFSGDVDLILTDPPYGISRKTGFKNIKNGVKRFGVDMDFGKWDHANINLRLFSKKSYEALRSGGTIIVFYDLWKISALADALRDAGFSKLRMIEWLKTNPVPLNSKATYLSNAREIAICAIKGESATFNGGLHNGVYEYPIPHGRDRWHPTQKPFSLIRDLVKRHSNQGDLVVDPYMGSGTTGVAALREDRRFVGGDIDEEFVNKAKTRIRDEYAVQPLFR